MFLRLKAKKGLNFTCFCKLRDIWGQFWPYYSRPLGNMVDFFWVAAKERLPDGRLLCNGTEACLGGTGTSGELEFRSSSNYLDCRGCLWMDLSEQFCDNFA